MRSPVILKIRLFGKCWTEGVNLGWFSHFLAPILEAPFGDPEASGPRTKIGEHCSRADVFKLEHASESPQRLVKT